MSAYIISTKWHLTWPLLASSEVYKKSIVLDTCRWIFASYLHRQEVIARTSRYHCRAVYCCRNVRTLTRFTVHLQWIFIESSIEIMAAINSFFAVCSAHSTYVYAYYIIMFQWLLSGRLMFLRKANACLITHYYLGLYNLQQILHYPCVFKKKSASCLLYIASISLESIHTWHMYCVDILAGGGVVWAEEWAFLRSA